MDYNAQNNYIAVSEHTYHQFDVFLDGFIGEPYRYRELISILFNANDGDNINIFINSSGGDLDSAMSIIEGIKTTRAEVTGIIIGACHSAASIISMYCHSVIVLDNAYSMIHTASFGSQGVAGNVKSHAEFTVDHVEKILDETYAGFLTKEELQKIKGGAELWFDAEGIRERIKGRVKALKTKLKKIQKEASNEE